MTDNLSDAELCALVEQHVFGYKGELHQYMPASLPVLMDEDGSAVAVRDFLTDDAAAISICKRMLELGWRCTLTLGTIGWCVTFLRPMSSPSFGLESNGEAAEDNLGRTVSIAALRALGVEV